MFRFKNIYKHLNSTLLAIVVFLATLLFVWFGKADFGEVWPAWLFVLTFLFYGGKPPKTNSNTPGIMGMAGLLLLFTLWGCTPQKRLNRLVKKHPELITTVVDTAHFDTTIVQHYDTARITETWQRIDTMQIHDTVILQGPKYTVTLHRTHYDTVKVEVAAQPDTIFITKDIPVSHKNISVVQKSYKSYEYILLYGALFIAALLILFITLKATKK